MSQADHLGLWTKLHDNCIGNQTATGVLQACPQDQTDSVGIYPCNLEKELDSQERQITHRDFHLAQVPVHSRQHTGELGDMLKGRFQRSAFACHRHKLSLKSILPSLGK